MYFAINYLKKKYSIVRYKDLIQLSYILFGKDNNNKLKNSKTKIIIIVWLCFKQSTPITYTNLK